jgi:hypothetical protein
MSVVSLFKIPGDPDQLFEIQQEKIADAAREHAVANGGIAHLVARTDDGLLVVNVWESPEAAAQAGKIIGPKAAEAGLSQQDYQQYEVLAFDTA